MPAVNARSAHIARTFRSVRIFVLALTAGLAASSLGFTLSACESAANLDVSYGDAATAALENDGGGAGAEGGEAGGPVVVPTTFSACPCDESAGLGCCLKNNEAFCTTDTTLCTGESGMHLRCGRPDPNTESVCCWHLGPGGKGAGATTAYASACDGGVPVCSSDSDCSGTGKPCKIAKCNGVEIGACADTAPPCPL